MNMKYEEFEKHIASNLRKQSTDLDIAALIEGIHGPKENKRPVFLFWLLGAVAVISIGLSSVFMYGDGSKLKENFDTNTNGEMKMNTISASNVQDKNNTNTPVHFTNNTTSLLNNDNQTTILTESRNNKQTPLQQKKETIANKKNGNTQYTNLATEIDTKTRYENVSQNVAINSMAERIPQSNSLLQIPTLLTGVDDISFLRKTSISPDKIQCPTFGKKSNYFLEIIPELGYFRPLKKLEQTSIEPNNIFALRNDNERSLEGLNTGLYLRLRNDKLPIYIQGGVSVSRLTERMSLDYAYTKRDTTKGIISITQSQTGDTITVIYGDIVQETKVTGQKTSHHNFTLIDFPISVGIEKRFGQWTAGLEGGVILNLSLSAGGQILATDTSFTAIDVPVSPYRQKLGLGYFGGVTIGKEFNQSGRIFLALRGRVIPVPFSSDQTAIRQSYSFIGLNAGYIYTF